MDERSETLVRPDENPELLGSFAHASADALSIPNFEKFIQLRLVPPTPPRRPSMAAYSGPNTAKRMTFEIVNQETKKKYLHLISTYEKEKAAYDVLNLYPADLAGYGKYLIERYPHVLAFFGEQRPFTLPRESRCSHKYLVGGTKSGKSEYLKSDVWYYLTEDTSTALVVIDPHSEVAEQIAQFRPNSESGRLAYVMPGINGHDFPGLNPFDVQGKESLSDKDADDYADEFVSAFKEILEGDLTAQMETLLRNTIPVLIKMPDTSVYDLISFLRPKPREVKAAKGDGEPIATKPYPAQKYLDFAKANFENEVMLDFLATQFDDDAGYVTTRNSLTTRLLGIFGSTLMQGIFKGKRTVRLEELIPQRKLIVFNLANLKTGTQVVGRFVLITLKIFALNQAKVPRHERTMCQVYVDECQTFITSSLISMLNESRKYLTFLVLAQQMAGGGMSAEMFSAVLANTATKIVGANGGPSLSLMAKEIGMPAETISEFKPGQFAVFQREASPQRTIVRMPTNTLGDRAGMPADQWQRVLSEQMQRYYRRPGMHASHSDKSYSVPNPTLPEPTGHPRLKADIDDFLN